jgi:amino acid permease
MEIIGASFVTIGVGMLSVPVAFVVAGVFLLTFAIAIERSARA